MGFEFGEEIVGVEKVDLGGFFEVGGVYESNV